MLSYNAMQRAQVPQRVLQQGLQMRFFGVTPKLAKMELTIRTPYRTLFKDFSGFTRVYATTIQGQMAVSQGTYPRVYILPPGEFTVMGISAGEGNHTTSDSGLFMHSGGWLHVHP